ncbi:hypothetical protein MNAN1_003643 [Malassezia nana]|uniref:PCI domain-containing protein n=1 Tax=Malassezia nana TaxID=180528 RepID=A0AAF0J914_9BASI|nr:hypothetical protein MNAN1_003643 [Malassezia nana]
MAAPADLEALVYRATITPGKLSYLDLYLHPSVQKLKEETVDAPLVRLLSLFAQGTWNDYAQAAEGVYPKLFEEQEAQLRRLSLVSLSQTSRCLPYAQVSSELGLTHDPLTIERLMLEAIDLGMLEGRLDGVKEVFHVSTTSVRDLLPLPEGEAALSSLHAALSAWKDDVAQVLHVLDSEIQQLRHATDASRNQRETRHQALVDALQAARESLSLSTSSTPGAPRRGKRSRA